jgi:hypothetical protein
LTVIEMPERCPSLPIFAPSPKPKRDVRAEGADLVVDNRDLTTQGFWDHRHDALPIDDEEIILDKDVNLDDNVKNKPVE